MEKSKSNASVRQNIKKTEALKAPSAEGGRLSTFMWLSRFFGGVCFLLTTSVAVLSLSLIHITKEAEVNTVLVTAPTYSENLSYFEPLHPDMPAMDILAEMFVRYYVTARNNVWRNRFEMRRMWGPAGVVRRMSTPAVYNAFVRREAVRYFPNSEKTPKVMIETDIKRIIKEGWNSWQIFFDTRKMETLISTPIIEHWIATIQFRYYPNNVFMFPLLRNPLGFTVTQYHLARQKK